MNRQLHILHLGHQPYNDIYEAMTYFTQHRTQEDPDKLLLLQHHPVYTYGQSLKPSSAWVNQIPTVACDRGGQATYHGPGQLIIYPLIDLKRKQLSPHDLINYLESSIVSWLKASHIDAQANPKARGIYIDEKKIASIGLRIKRGCSYHGISLNLHQACLNGFGAIDTCGNPDLEVVSLDTYLPEVCEQTVKQQLCQYIINQLSQKQPYDAIQDQTYDETTRAKQAIKNPH